MLNCAQIRLHEKTGISYQGSDAVPSHLVQHLAMFLIYNAIQIIFLSLYVRVHWLSNIYAKIRTLLTIETKNLDKIVGNCNNS